MKIAPVLASLFGLVGCCCLTPLTERELFAVDSTRLAPADAERVMNLYHNPTLAVELEPRLVDSSKELYDFLIEELPFTASCVRALDRGKYVITREEPHTYFVDDKVSMKLEMRRLYQDERRWVYVGRVIYEGTSFGKITGDALTIAAATPTEGGLLSEARIYVRLDALTGFLAKLVPGLFASALRRKATLFTEAAKVVSEESKRDPAGFYEKIKASPEVDPNTLEKFRRRFIK
jgi:hypothetical protein